MKRTEAVELTNMCMVYDGDKILVQDKLDDSYRGVVFPGGHVERGESCTDAVIREVYEETGLTISSPQLCGIKEWINSDGTRYLILLYKTNQFTGTLKSSDEGEVYWIDRDELSDEKTVSDMDGLLRVFLEDSFSELRYEIRDGKWEYQLK